jgi:hypothetical protein
MIMDAVYDTGIFSTKELDQINRVRHYKKVTSVGDLVGCDGRSILPEMYTPTGGESRWKFPHQQPTTADFQVWRKGLGALSRTGNKLYLSLGKFTAAPHKPDNWFINNAETDIYHRTTTGAYEHYSLTHCRRTTRFGAKFALQQMTLEHPSLDKRLTPHNWTGDEVRYHSAYPINLPQSETPTTMLDIIESQENKSLWTNLRVDGDDGGKWIYTSLMAGTLAAGHDGSYQQDLATDICAGAAVLYSTSTDQYAELTWVEKSDNKTATNYRGEILGAIATQLLIKFAVEGREVTGHRLLGIGCDNMGVVHHGNNPKRPLKEKQSQADLLRLLKHLVEHSKVRGELRHVHSHSDKHTRREDMTLAQFINVRADEIVGKALTTAIAKNRFITGVFPLEKVVIMTDGRRVSGSPKEAILELWGERVAIELFHRRKIVAKQLFPYVYWEGMHQVMRSFPVMFRTWITKHVSHFNGTNRQLSRWDGTVRNVCPNCNRNDESTTHINRCPDPGRRRVMKDSVNELRKWMDSEQTDGELTSLICRYVNHHGESTMVSLLSSTQSKYKAAAILHDTLGWSNFMEGRISVMWVDHRKNDIQGRKLRRGWDSWARGLMRRLLQMTHQQWMYRNATVHLKIKHGCTAVEHRRLLDEINLCLDIDPEDLLHEHKQLLFTNFKNLAKGPVKDKREWLAEFHAARSLARHVGRGTRVTLRTRYTQAKHPRIQLVREVAQVDSEGSQRWRRRIRI